VLKPFLFLQLTVQLDRSPSFTVQLG